MAARIRAVLLVLLAATAYAKKDPLVGAPMCDLIAAEGYTCEQHFVETTDGYVLGVFRIPNPGKPPVVFQHGFVDTSATWVMNHKDQSIGFLAHDAGYDVWFSNSRGNKYSLNATFCSDCEKSDQFWDFSFDEMALFDTPAVMHYVLNTTSHTKLTWVGHSQGTTMMFAAMAKLQNQVTDYLNSFVAVAPVAFLTHVKPAIMRTIAKTPEGLVKKLFRNVFPPGDDWIDRLVPGTCAAAPRVCESVIFAICGGGDSHQLNRTRLPVFTSHTPSTTSTKDLIHWAQLIKTGEFKMYDYGSPEANRQAYGTPNPPMYEVDKLPKVPISFLYGSLDFLGDPEDVEHLLKVVPPADIAFAKEYDLNHMDFVWGFNITSLVYTPMLDFIGAHLV